jgi:hypothetical protein
MPTKIEKQFSAPFFLLNNLLKGQSHAKSWRDECMGH